MRDPGPIGVPPDSPQVSSIGQNQLRVSAPRISFRRKRVLSRAERTEATPFVTSTVVSITLLVFLSAAQVFAQEKLRIAYAGGASVVPLWIVQERGLLKKENIQAEMVQIDASPAALQAMLAGEVELNVASVTTLVSSRLAGADVVMLMAVVPTFPNYLIAGKHVQNVQEFKGKAGGGNRFWRGH